MILQMHISNATPEMRDWLDRNGYVLSADWLDCTNYMRDFNPAKVADFCSLLCEITSVDMQFDRYQILPDLPAEYDDFYVEHDALGGDWEG